MTNIITVKTNLIRGYVMHEREVLARIGAKMENINGGIMTWSIDVSGNAPGVCVLLGYASAHYTGLDTSLEGETCYTMMVDLTETDHPAVSQIIKKSSVPFNY